MDNGNVYGRGVAFPVRVGGDGRLAWSAGADNVRESIQVILLTQPGERLQLPEFGGGLRRFLFEPNTASTHTLIAERIQAALGTWEPRVKLESVEVAVDPDDPQAAIATLTYRLVATQALERVALSVSVAH